MTMNHKARPELLKRESAVRNRTPCAAYSARAAFVCDAHRFAG
jgi:hypothetical protein